MPNKIAWTFKTWVANFKDVDLPIGELSHDVERDVEFPDTDDFYDLVSYIARKSGYDTEIIETFRVVWSFYQSST